MQEKNQLTIAFHPDGTVQHTLNDKFMKLDLGVERDVQRMTDVRHVKAADCYVVYGLMAPFKNDYFDKRMAEKFGVDIEGIPHTTDRQGVFMFADYDDAVRLEIRITDQMRVLGYLIYDDEKPHTIELDLSADEAPANPETPASEPTKGE